MVALLRIGQVAAFHEQADFGGADRNVPVHVGAQIVVAAGGQFVVRYVVLAEGAQVVHGEDERAMGQLEAGAHPARRNPRQIVVAGGIQLRGNGVGEGGKRQLTIGPDHRHDGPFHLEAGEGGITLGELPHGQPVIFDAGVRLVDEVGKLGPVEGAGQRPAFARVLQRGVQVEGLLFVEVRVTDVKALGGEVRPIGVQLLADRHARGVAAEQGARPALCKGNHGA